MGCYIFHIWLIHPCVASYAQSVSRNLFWERWTWNVWIYFLLFFLPLFSDCGNICWDSVELNVAHILHIIHVSLMLLCWLKASWGTDCSSFSFSSSWCFVLSALRIQSRTVGQYLKKLLKTVHKLFKELNLTNVFSLNSTSSHRLVWIQQQWYIISRWKV